MSWGAVERVESTWAITCGDCGYKVPGVDASGSCARCALDAEMAARGYGRPECCECGNDANDRDFRAMVERHEAGQGPKPTTALGWKHPGACPWSAP